LPDGGRKRVGFVPGEDEGRCRGNFRNVGPVLPTFRSFKKIGRPGRRLAPGNKKRGGQKKKDVASKSEVCTLKLKGGGKKPVRPSIRGKWTLEKCSNGQKGIKESQEKYSSRELGDRTGKEDKKSSKAWAKTSNSHEKEKLNSFAIVEGFMGLVPLPTPGETA